MQEYSTLLLIGGLALFIYGLRLARIGLQEVSEDRLRSLIASMTGNRFSALGLGVLVTAILQSSTATTVMLVGFANTSLITLSQAMGVILGADIGTTITVQLISFRLADWSLIFVIIGILLEHLWRESRLNHVGNVILGFGFVFYGMFLMSDAMSPLKNSADFQQFLLLINDKPILIIIVAAVFTALVHSSAATIGLVLSLAQAGSMTLDIAIPMVLGANIGTCATAIMAGMASGDRGKQVAYAHLGFKVLGTLLILPILPQFAKFCHYISDLFWVGESSIVRQVANAHAIFNIAISIVFLPFIGWGAKLMEKLAPVPKVPTEQGGFSTQFLDSNALETPALAQGCVTREILRVAGVVHEMYNTSINLFKKPDKTLFDQIEEADDRVDYLDRQIRFYLAKIAQRPITKEQSARNAHLLNITANLEYLGDVINRDLVKLAKKKLGKERDFSKEGWDEIKDFHEKVSHNFDLALAAFADRNEELARKVIRHERTLGELEHELKQNHLSRLQAGLKESFDTSSIHLELLAELRRINTLLNPLVHSVISPRSKERGF